MMDIPKNINIIYSKEVIKNNKSILNEIKYKLFKENKPIEEVIDMSFLNEEDLKNINKNYKKLKDNLEIFKNVTAKYISGRFYNENKYILSNTKLTEENIKKYYDIIELFKDDNYKKFQEKLNILNERSKYFKDEIGYTMLIYYIHTVVKLALYINNNFENIIEYYINIGDYRELDLSDIEF